MNTQIPIKEFIEYLSFPEINPEKGSKINVFTVTVMYFLVLIIGFMFYAPLMSYIGVDDMSHKVEDYLKELSRTQILLFTVFLAPIIEELLFRFHLKHPRLILIFVVFSIFALVHSFLGLTQSKMTVIISFGLIVFTFLFLQIGHVLKSWKSIVTRYYGVFFYWTVIVFAFFHAFNFETTDIQWYFIPVLVMPQFTLALLLGYVRIKKHLGYAIYIHGLNNLIPVLAWMFLQ